MNASTSWIALVLVLGGCCHLGGHDDTQEQDAPLEHGCLDDDVDPTHEGHDEEPEPCDAGVSP